MIFAALDEAAGKGELFLIDGGLCRWHLRRDGVIVIREILVLPLHRRLGKGRELVEMVHRQRPGAALLARCPARLEANAFWAALGFKLTDCKEGISTWLRG